MSPDRDRILLDEVVGEVAGEVAEVAWLAPTARWSAHARLRGTSGLTSHLLTGPEWQEVRFDEPRLSAFVLTSTEDDDVRDALRRLARAAVAYVEGRGRIEHRTGWFRRGRILVLPTSDGEWHVGTRGSRPPH